MSAPPPSGYYPPPGYYAAPSRPSRPIGVAILAILVVLVGVLALIAAIGILVLSGFLALTGLHVLGLGAGIIGGVVLIFAVICIAAGLGLWHLRSWAWWLAMIVLILSLFGGLASPLYALLSLLLVVYLILVRHHFR